MTSEENKNTSKKFKDNLIDISFGIGVAAATGYGIYSYIKGDMMEAKNGMFGAFSLIGLGGLNKLFRQIS